jgi:Flp pilus assembly protein TadD
MVLATLKRPADALASFEKALAIDPANVGALANRGRMLVETGRAAEGLASLDKALQLEPKNVEARINRGNALVRLDRHGEAIAEYDSALAIVPQHPGAHYNRGNALFSQGRAADAVQAFQKSLEANPRNETAWNARGVALQALNRNPDAVQSFEQAIALNKNYPDAHFNMSLSLLLQGDYPRGFSEYEWRWTRSGMQGAPKFKRSAWTGAEPLAGKTILVHAEQGLGDSVMFARYVPDLVKQGANVVLQVQPELKSLFAGFAGAQVIARGEPEPKYDLHCAMGSLPLAFKTTPASVPAPIPYLTAPADRVEKWRARLSSLAQPRIALVWAGSAKHANDRNRSVPLSLLLPLLETGASFLSLQHEPRADDAAILASEPRITHLGGEISDFADTAAILSLCDLIISVDTSVAHVAGAMGVPLFMLIPFAPDWRWTLGAQSPWYPQARLFRQSAPGDWTSVISGVGTALKQRTGNP